MTPVPIPFPSHTVRDIEEAYLRGVEDSADAVLQYANDRYEEINLRYPPQPREDIVAALKVAASRVRNLGHPA